MYSKVEFILYSDYTPATKTNAEITALAAAIYTDLYDCDLSATKTLGLTDYFGNEPKTFDFSLVYDTWIEDNIINAANDLSRDFSKYVIRVYDGSDYVFSGIMDLAYFNIKFVDNKVKLRAYDWLILLNKAKDLYLKTLSDDSTLFYAYSMRKIGIENGVTVFEQVPINGTTFQELQKIETLIKFLYLWVQGYIWETSHDYVYVWGVDKTITDGYFNLKLDYNITPFQLSNPSSNFIDIGALGIDAFESQGGIAAYYAKGENLVGNEFKTIKNIASEGVFYVGSNFIALSSGKNYGFEFLKNGNIAFIYYSFCNDTQYTRWELSILYCELSSGLKIGTVQQFYKPAESDPDGSVPESILADGNTYLNSILENDFTNFFTRILSGSQYIPVYSPFQTTIKEGTTDYISRTRYIAGVTPGFFNDQIIISSNFQELSDTLPLKQVTELKFSDLYKTATIGCNGSFVIDKADPDKIKFINKYSDSSKAVTDIADEDIIIDCNLSRIAKQTFDSLSFFNVLDEAGSKNYINLLNSRYNEFFITVNNNIKFTVSNIFNDYSGLTVQDKIDVLGYAQVIYSHKKEDDFFAKIESMNYLNDYLVDELGNYFVDELGNKFIMPAF